MSSAFDYDVVIAGGGMVGSTLALLLNHYRRSSLKVLVVESQAIPSAPAQYHTSFDARSTALSYSSRQILESLGFWPELTKHCADILQIHVSDRGHGGSAHLTCEQQAWPAMGYVVENAWFGRLLMQRLQACVEVEFKAPATVEKITPRQQGVSLSIHDGEESQQVTAQLIVVADGAQSRLRQQLAIAATVKDYQQTALIANVCFTQRHQGMAYERFTDQGPMALLPLNNSERGEPCAALVWTLPAEQAEHLCQCEENEFLARLQQRFGHRQGQFTRVGARFSYPLTLVEASEQVRSGIVVMGNAAHSLHPVAGQGFNLALRDCQRLVDVLLAAAGDNQSLGSLPVLQRYQQQQQMDQASTIAFSHYLPSVFTSQNLAVQAMRNVGLSVLDLLPPLKQRFVQQAAGMNDGTAAGFAL